MGLSEVLHPVQRGVVASFDEAAGHGVVTTPEGISRFFHCVAIADGSRTIQQGTSVAFAVVPGRLGRWEATDLTSF